MTGLSSPSVVTTHGLAELSRGQCQSCQDNKSGQTQTHRHGAFEHEVTFHPVQDPRGCACYLRSWALKKLLHDLHLDWQREGERGGEVLLIGIRSLLLSPGPCVREVTRGCGHWKGHPEAPLRSKETQLPSAIHRCQVRTLSALGSHSSSGSLAQLFFLCLPLDQRGTAQVFHEPMPTGFLIYVGVEVRS